MSGFIKMRRCEELSELWKDHPAFVLLSVIAYRARRTNRPSITKLARGEALIGDHDAYGMTESQYRAAKRRLEESGFATFRATTKGTIAKLTSTHVYDINEDDSDDRNDEPTTDERRTSDDQTTDKRRTNDGQATTNKKVKNVECKNESLSKREGGESSIASSEEAYPALCAALVDTGKLPGLTVAHVEGTAAAYPGAALESDDTLRRLVALAGSMAGKIEAADGCAAWLRKAAARIGEVRPLLIGLRDTGKFPALEYEHLVRVDRDYPKARLFSQEARERLIEKARGVTGTVNDSAAWLDRAASKIEAKAASAPERLSDSSEDKRSAYQSVMRTGKFPGLSEDHFISICDECNFTFSRDSDVWEVLRLIEQAGEIQDPAEWISDTVRTLRRKRQEAIVNSIRRMTGRRASRTRDGKANAASGKGCP